MLSTDDVNPAPVDRIVGRDLEIAKIAWKQGYGHGHNDAVEGHYAPPDEYEYDVLMKQIEEGIFDDVPPNVEANGAHSAPVQRPVGLQNNNQEDKP